MINFVLGFVSGQIAGFSIIVAGFKYNERKNNEKK
jgi:hypothetical protein